MGLLFPSARHIAVDSTVGRVLSEHAFSTARARTQAVCRVRCVEGEEKMTITLVYKGAERVMVRKQDEALSNTVARMQKSLSANSKKGAVHLADGESLRLTDAEGVAVPPGTLNRNAWTAGCVLALGADSWCISRNGPAITALQVKQPVFAGFGVQPIVSTEFADAVAFRWFRSSLEGTPQAADTSAGALGVKETDGWQLVQDGEESYTPTPADVGAQLRLEAVPVQLKDDGEQLVSGSISTVDVAGRVQVALDLSVYSERQKHIERYSTCFRRDNTLRVVSYNLLSDNTPASRNGRYSFCTAEALDIHFRKQLLSWELRLYDADVLCLQEVTPSAFQGYIAPQLRAAGWAALYLDKNFTSTMGCVVLYRMSKFELCSEDRVDLFREWRGLDIEQFPRFVREWPDKVTSSFPLACLPEQLVKNLDGNSAVAQIIGLRPKFGAGADPLFVLNTHLMGHPKEEIGRVIQVTTIMRKLRAIMYERHGLHDAAVIFGGDFNSTAEEAAHRLLETGRMAQSDGAWADAHRLFAKASSQPSFVKPSWDAVNQSAAVPLPCEHADGAAGSEGDKHIGGVDIELPWMFSRGATHVRRTYFDPHDFPDACDFTSPRSGQDPDASTTAGSDSAVDFIYHNHALRPAPGWGQLPNFPTRALLAHTNIPSPQFGSDHIALVDEFELVLGGS